MTPRRNWFIVFVILAISALGVVFAPWNSFFRKTYSVFLETKSATGVVVGAPVIKYDITIGHVHKLTLTPNGDIMIQLRIFAGFPLHKSDVCVIHRLHRYDTATLHIESPLRPPLPLGDPPILDSFIANGPWPSLPGFAPNSETKQEMPEPEHQLNRQPMRQL